MAGQELLSMNLAGEELDRAICLAVRRIGQSAIPLLRPIVENNDQERLPLAPDILEDLPFEESADLVLAHWFSLRADHRDWLRGVAELLGDNRFIPPFAR